MSYIATSSRLASPNIKESSTKKRYDIGGHCRVIGIPLRRFACRAAWSIEERPSVKEREENPIKEKEIGM